ncbi:MAG: hypothetical protein ABMA00_13660 [Gemmatimonas sp.]
MTEIIHDINDLDKAIAQAEAEAAALKAKRDAAIAVERPDALKTVLALITKHAITKAELDPALRKRAFAPKPRKAKVPSLVVPNKAAA